MDVGADELPAFLAGLGPEWRGLSLTMPLKAAVLPLLDDVEPLAAAVGAANTVVLHGGRRSGTNTDVGGIVAALAEHGATSASRAVVLGGGATARSALAALAQLGERRPRLAVRSEPVETLAAAERLGVEPTVVALGPAALADADVVISTLPPGAADVLAAAVGDVPVLLDVAYGAGRSALARACRGTVVRGELMLLHQAAAQVRLMTGLDAPLEQMRSALG